MDGGGLACASPPSATGVGSVPLRVSNDGGRRWSVADDRLFTYYTTALPLTLSSAAPSAADAAAATTTVEVAGANFAPLGDALRCRFGAAAATAATFVDGGRVRCEAHAPSAAAGSVDLRLSRDGGHSWSDGALPFTFYDAPPAVADVARPGLRPMRAPPAVTLRGANFAPLAALRCRFGGAPPVLARFRSGGEVECTPAPLAAAGPVNVSVSTGGGGWSAPLLWYAIDARAPPRVTAVAPAYAADDASQTLTLAAENIAPTGQLACVLGDAALLPATLRPPSTVKCVAPALGLSQSLDVRLSATGELAPEHLSAPAPAAGFTAYDDDAPPALAYVSPRVVPADRAAPTALRVAGHNFAPTAALACRLRVLPPPEAARRRLGFFGFGDEGAPPPPPALAAVGDTLRLAATFVSATEVTCTLPAHLANLTSLRAAVAVTTDGATFGGEELVALLGPAPPTTRAVDPSAAPLDASATARVVGTNFDADALSECALTPLHGGGSLRTMAVVDSVAEAHCALPAGAAAGTYRVGLVGGDSDAEAPADAATITLVDASQPPAVSAVAPAFASRHQPERIVVAGGNFAPSPSLACEFAWGGSNGSARRAATFVDGGHLECESPPADAPADATVRVTASADGWGGSAPVAFALYEPSAPPTPIAATPAAGAAAGGTLVTVRATNAPPTGAAVCHFGRATVPASAGAPGTLRCVAPPAADASADGRTVELTLSLTAGGARSTPLNFSYFEPSDPPAVSAVAPPLVATAAAPPLLTVRGANFGRGALTCEFTKRGADGGAVATLVEVGWFVDAATLHCRAPSLSSAVTVGDAAAALATGALELRVVAGGERSEEALQLDLYDATRPPELLSSEPPYVTVGGGDEVTLALRARNAPPTAALWCRQLPSGDGAPATAGGDGVVRCTVPRPAAPGAMIVQLSHSGRLGGFSTPLSLAAVNVGAPADVRQLLPYSADRSELPTTVTAVADNVAPLGDALRCRLLGGGPFVPSPATYVAPGRVACAVPASLPSGESSLALSLDGGASWGAAAAFYVTDLAAPPAVASVTPRFASNDTTTLVTVTGANLPPPPAVVLCRFGTAPPAAAQQWLSTTAVRCAAPPRATPGEVRLTLSVEGGLTSDTFSAISGTQTRRLSRWWTRRRPRSARSAAVTPCALAAPTLRRWAMGGSSASRCAERRRASCSTARRRPPPSSPAVRSTARSAATPRWGRSNSTPPSTAAPRGASEAPPSRGTTTAARPRWRRSRPSLAR